MTTTLTAGTLTATVTEAITMNGVDHGATNVRTVSSVAEISKRIITITTAECVIATFSAAVASAGHYVAANVRYMRFTNKDDENFITLTFRNQDNDEAAIQLDFGQSFIWNGDNTAGLVDVLNATEDANAASDTALGDLTNIQADAKTGDCDLEIFIASV